MSVKEATMRYEFDHDGKILEVGQVSGSDNLFSFSLDRRFIGYLKKDSAGEYLSYEPDKVTDEYLNILNLQKSAHPDWHWFNAQRWFHSRAVSQLDKQKADEVIKSLKLAYDVYFQKRHSSWCLYLNEDEEGLNYLFSATDAALSWHILTRMPNTTILNEEIDLCGFRIVCGGSNGLEYKGD